MGGDAEFSCSCGAFRGHLSADGLKAGTRVVCFCKSCRENELAHGQPDPAPDPVDLFQVSPAAITITKGAEHLQLLRLSPKGTLRWYAGCCGTPFANTTAKRSFPFAGLRADVFADKTRLGKVRARAFIPQAAGKPPKTEGAGRMAYGILTRVMSAYLSGTWKDTPFFRKDGAPAAAARILTKEERAALSK
jgi:hypothetical protein